MTTGPLPPLNADGLPQGMQFDPQWEVTPRQVRAAMAAPEGKRPLLLDCRRADEWQVARIGGAVLFPMDQIKDRLEEIEDAAGGKDAPIIVYCHHGRRSLRVTAELRQAGFTDVKSMAGGIDVWSMDIDPGAPRY